MDYDYLDELESRSVYIIREAYRRYKDKLTILVSWGKDSTTMLYLARKAFLGKVIIPVVHIDTLCKFREIRIMCGTKQYFLTFPSTPISLNYCFINIPWN